MRITAANVFQQQHDREVYPVIGHKRLSICYAVPGHNLLPSAGPTRNVLSLAEAMSQWADVTVAFCRVLEPISSNGYEVVEIDPTGGRSLHSVDDAALRGMSIRELAAYLGSVRRFVEERLHSYDIVLEKSWLLSGYLVALRQARGLPAAVVENIVRVWHEPIRNPQQFMRYMRHLLANAVVGRYLRRTPLIIAETEQLKAVLVERWRIPSARIKVVGLGVNHHLFRPMDQAEARRRLGISLDATVFLYAGVLDRTHNLVPILEAMREMSDASLEFHIVGDGVLRGLYEAKARAGRRNVYFRGRVPHAAMPQYIAAADLCLAPYDPAAFPNGQVAYSTLKIPEYMACARPVVSVPSGHILRLIQHGVSGYLFDNDVNNWVGFLRQCPSREQLRHMGAAAASTVVSCGWEDVARAYLALCEQAVMNNKAQPTKPGEP